MVDQRWEAVTTSANWMLLQEAETTDLALGTEKLDSVTGFVVEDVTVNDTILTEVEHRDTGTCGMISSLCWKQTQ